MPPEDHNPDDPHDELPIEHLAAEFDRIIRAEFQPPTLTTDAQRRLLKRLEAMPHGVRFPPEDAMVEFVTDPHRGCDFDIRHEEHLLTEKVVEALVSASGEKIRRVAQEINDVGAFFKPYNGVGKERISQSIRRERSKEGGWAMLEASGRIVDTTTYRAGPMILGGDGHFFIPADDNIPLGDLSLPTGGKDIVLAGRDIMQEILNDPACAILIADICSTKEAHGAGFASLTEDVAMHQAAQLNQERKHALRYALAEIYSIKRLQDHSGRLIGPQVDLLNAVSVILHTRRKARAPGLLLGILTGQSMSVQLPAGDSGSLVYDKYVTVQPLDQIMPRSDVKVVNGLF